MVLYRNTQQDLFDIFQFIKELVLFLEQIFKKECARILRSEIYFYKNEKSVLIADAFGDMTKNLVAIILPELLRRGLDFCTKV
jgi:hypothetical protein